MKGFIAFIFFVTASASWAFPGYEQYPERSLEGICSTNKLENGKFEIIHRSILRDRGQGPDVVSYGSYDEYDIEQVLIELEREGICKIVVNPDFEEDKKSYISIKRIN